MDIVGNDTGIIFKANKKINMFLRLTSCFLLKSF